MKLRVKDMDIATGDIQIVILNEKDAQDLDLRHLDRIVVKKGRKTTVAILDIAESKKAVPRGCIGLFEETLDALKAKQGDSVVIELADKPVSITFIRKKLDGAQLTESELHAIVQDIVHNKLTDVELTSFVIGTYTRGMSLEEIAALTKAMVETGDTITFDHRPIVDLHSIGGVPGNRTTMLIVPILVAIGCTVPKTSSRAITSPAGTADTMEVLCSVSLNAKQLQRVAKKVGGFITWGGAVNLAPADDKIIRVEHPLSIDAEGQMIASIMAKKASVGATHLLMEIPYGPGSKVPTRAGAQRLEKQFHALGKILDIEIKCILETGSEPVGNGIGPVLEMRDVLWALTNSPRAPRDLVNKSLELAATLLEFVGKAPEGTGLTHAKNILDSGKAYDAFCNIIRAQKGKIIAPEKLTPAKHMHIVKANAHGTVQFIDNNAIAKIARLAGAPQDKDAGVFLYKHCGDRVRKGDTLFEIYARHKTKLQNAIDSYKKYDGFSIK